jgi:hypothetical protein
MCTSPFEIDGRSIHLTISIGVSAFPDHGRDIETLVKRADAALYRAKGEGRDRVCIEDSRSGGRAPAAKDTARPARKRRGRKKEGPARRPRRPRAARRSATRRRKSR